MTNSDLRKRPRWCPSSNAVRDLFYCMAGTYLFFMLMAGARSGLDPMVFLESLWVFLLSLLLGFAGPFIFLGVIFEERTEVFGALWLLLPLAIGAGIAFSASIETRWVRLAMMGILLPSWMICGGLVTMAIAMG